VGGEDVGEAAAQQKLWALVDRLVKTERLQQVSEAGGSDEHSDLYPVSAIPRAWLSFDGYMFYKWQSSEPIRSTAATERENACILHLVYLQLCSNC
jgi:hypothetical protein